MRLYISYSQNDYSTASTIVDILRFSGHDPMFGHRVPQRRDWKTISRQGIEAADVCVIFLSPRAVESAKCQFEWAQAFQLDKPIVPVLLERCPIPVIMHELQYTDFSGDDILIAVAQLLGGLYVFLPGQDYDDYGDDYGHGYRMDYDDTDDEAGVDDYVAQPRQSARSNNHHTAQAPHITLMQPQNVPQGDNSPPEFDEALLGFEDEIPSNNGHVSDDGPPIEYDPIFAEDAPSDEQSPPAALNAALNAASKTAPNTAPTDPRRDAYETQRRHEAIQQEIARLEAALQESPPGRHRDSTAPPPTLPEINMDESPDEDDEFPYEPALVVIPGGQFVMGSDLRADDLASETEVPQHIVTVGEFQIGRFPVTVNEFWAFVDEGGYYEASFWTDSGWAWREANNVTQPRYWDDEKWSGNGYLPVIGVSWYEAIAYTQWLAEVTNELYRLPTESEWEKAARGTDARLYPWGNDWHLRLCNVAGGGMWRTTSVGYYSPDGDSPYGIADMSGNVWEWCMTKWRDRYTELEDNGYSGDAARCLRGGSWFSQRQDVRTTARARDQAGDRDDHLGFRVACGPMPIPPSRT